MVKYPVFRLGVFAKAQRTVPYPTPEEVKILAEKATQSRIGKNREAGFRWECKVIKFYIGENEGTRWAQDC